MDYQTPKIKYNVDLRSIKAYESYRFMRLFCVQKALSVVREQLSELHEQQDKISELLEKGVYTVDMFSKRNSALEREIRKLQSAETDLLEKSESQEQVESERAEVIPATQHILEKLPM